MYNNIDEKLKGLAGIIAFVGITIGGIWLIYVISESQNIYSEKDKALYYGKMVYSLILMATSVILSYFIYALGQIITHLKRIDTKLNGELINDDNEEYVKDEEIITELEDDTQESE